MHRACNRPCWNPFVRKPNCYIWKVRRTTHDGGRRYARNGCAVNYLLTFWANNTFFISLVLPVLFALALAPARRLLPIVSPSGTPSARCRLPSVPRRSMLFLAFCAHFSVPCCIAMDVPPQSNDLICDDQHTPVDAVQPFDN